MMIYAYRVSVGLENPPNKENFEVGAACNGNEA
jgi:hypothetical protein